MASDAQFPSFKLGDHIYELTVDDKLKTRLSETFDIADIEYGNLILRRESGLSSARADSKKLRTVPLTGINTAVRNKRGTFLVTAYLESDDLECANELFLAKFQEEVDYYAIRARFWASLIDVWKEKNQCHRE